jgi:hypothetical protein
VRSSGYAPLLQSFPKEKPTARSLLAVGSGLSKIALHHPIPSSRRHEIRVDMLVLVDVIRVALWSLQLIDMLVSDGFQNTARMVRMEIQNTDVTNRNSA